MKLKLLTFLFLLTGFGYVLQSLELDSKEYNQNYETENHSVIIPTDNTDNFAFHFVKAFDTPITYNQFIFCTDFCSQIIQLFFLKEPSPPNKIYLQQLSLLI